MTDRVQEGEVRLIAVPIEHVDPDGVIRTPADAWENGITEEERKLAAHCVEAHAAFAPDDELGPLRALRDKLTPDHTEGP